MTMTLFTGCVTKTNNKNKDTQENKTLNPNETIFLEILKTNEDGLSYLQKNPHTKVIRQEKISPNQFEELKNKTQFKALYENLPQKELYRVDFKSDNSDLSLMTIIDLENQQIINIYGNFIKNIK
jgi:hypothetical protein